MIFGIQYLSAASLCQVTTELTLLNLCNVGRNRAFTTSLVSTLHSLVLSFETSNTNYSERNSCTSLQLQARCQLNLIQDNLQIAALRRRRQNTGSRRLSFETQAIHPPILISILLFGDNSILLILLKIIYNTKTNSSVDTFMYLLKKVELEYLLPLYLACYKANLLTIIVIITPLSQLRSSLQILYCSSD